MQLHLHVIDFRQAQLRTTGPETELPIGERIKPAFTLEAREPTPTAKKCRIRLVHPMDHVLQNLRIDLAPPGIGLLARGQLPRLQVESDRSSAGLPCLTPLLSSIVIQMAAHFRGVEASAARGLRLGKSRYLNVLLVFKVLLDDRQGRPADRADQITVRPQGGQAGAQGAKLLPQSVRGNPLPILNQPMDAKLRVYFDEHMDVVGHDCQSDDFRPIFVCRLPKYRLTAFCHRANQPATSVCVWAKPTKTVTSMRSAVPEKTR
jgi:hypothetical protein